MAMTIVNQSGTGIHYTVFAAYGSGVGSGAPATEGSRGSGTTEVNRGSGTAQGSRGSGTAKGSASGVAPSGVKASGLETYTISHDWMQTPGHTLSVSGG